MGLAARDIRVVPEQFGNAMTVGVVGMSMMYALLCTAPAYSKKAEYLECLVTLAAAEVASNAASTPSPNPSLLAERFLDVGHVARPDQPDPHTKTHRLAKITTPAPCR